MRLLFFLREFFFRVRCSEEHSSSEKSGREVGGTMGGRMICIFIDAHTAVKKKAKGPF